MPDDVSTQVGPPDNEHLLLETWNKYTEKVCVKLVINQNYVEMHGQQNIKFRKLSSL
jgi:hypothetical protein